MYTITIHFVRQRIANITSISFEEIEKGVKKNKIWHTQTLIIEFRENKLFRFSISEDREQE